MIGYGIFKHRGDEYVLALSAQERERHLAIGCQEIEPAGGDKVITVPTSDLPEVTARPSGAAVGGMLLATGPEAAQGLLRSAAALVDHYEKNPPVQVDEAQVEALSALMSDIDPNPHGWYKADSPMLREMVKRGVRVEVKK